MYLESGSETMCPFLLIKSLTVKYVWSASHWRKYTILFRIFLPKYSAQQLVYTEQKIFTGGNPKEINSQMKLTLLLVADEIKLRRCRILFLILYCFAFQWHGHKKYKSLCRYSVEVWYKHKFVRVRCGEESRTSFVQQQDTCQRHCITPGRQLWNIEFQSY
jgi:hypothetical protein